MVFRFVWTSEVSLEDGSLMDTYRHDVLMDACVWGYRWRFAEGGTATP